MFWDRSDTPTHLFERMMVALLPSALYDMRGMRLATHSKPGLANLSGAARHEPEQCFGHAVLGRYRGASFFSGEIGRLAFYIYCCAPASAARVTLNQRTAPPLVNST
jgi:hypothetical protein